MQEQRRVVLIGESLLMDGIAANFRRSPVLQVIQVGQHVPDLQGCLKSLAPDVIIFDLDVVVAESVCCLLESQSDVCIVGVDAGCRRALMLCSSRRVIPTMRGLMRLVEGRTSDLAEVHS